MKIFFTYLLFFLSYTLWAQAVFVKKQQLDSIVVLVKNTPKEAERTPEELVAYYRQHFTSDYSLVAALYLWTALHLVYDDRAFNSQVYPSQEALSVFKARKGVCAGYSNLFTYFCTLANIQCLTVRGFAKGYSYSPANPKVNHDWNIVYLSTDTLLCDVTWGSSYASNVNGKAKSTSRLQTFWFDTPANEFIFTHFPLKSIYQYNTPVLQKKQFDALPKLESSFFMLFHSNSTILKELMNNKSLQVVDVLNTNTEYEGKDVPYTATLNKNQTYRFSLYSEDITRMAIIEEGKWTYIEPVQHTFTIEFKSLAKKITLCVLHPSGKYYTLLHYTLR